jgi:hypothetical protein
LGTDFTESIDIRKGTFDQGISGLYIFVQILKRNVPYANVILDDSPPFCKTILTNHFCYLFSLLPGQSKWLEVLQNT